MNGYFIFDDIDTRNYNGVYVYFDDIDASPSRAGKYVDVPGRNGAIFIDEGRFEDVTHTYDVIALSREVGRNLINDIASKTGHFKLQDSFNTDEFYSAAFASEVEPNVTKERDKITFKIMFTRKPQRFLVSGETVTTLTSSGTITNPTQFPSKPLIVVTGTGTLTVNGTAVTFSASPTTIDCETMEAYNGTTSRNGSIVLGSDEFPVLSAGSNTISKTSGITQIKITPRWWRI